MWMNGSVSRCVYVCVWCWTGSCGPLEERKINTPPAAWQLEKVGAQRRDPRLCPHPGSQHQMMLSLNSPPKKVANWTAYWETRQESSSPSSWASRSATTDLIQAFCHLWNCTALRVFHSTLYLIDNFFQTGRSSIHQFSCRPERFRAQQLCSPSGCRTMEESDRSPAGERVNKQGHSTGHCYR